MEKFRMFFHHNIVKIIAAIIGIVLLIMLLQALNSYFANKNQNEASSITTTDYGRDYTVTTDVQKVESVYKEETGLMQQFVDSCNSKNYEEAYNLLTEDCKEVLYPNLNLFIEKYCNIYFGTAKTCNFQAWNTSTYMVEIRNDALTSGQYSDINYVQDYFTISKNKINVNRFIERKDISKEKTFYNNVTVKVDYIDYYIDYTIVSILASNPSKGTVLLDSMKQEHGITLVDENDVEYSSNIEEIPAEQLMLKPGETKRLELRYDTSYREDREFINVTFKNLFIEKGGLQKNVKFELY